MGKPWLLAVIGLTAFSALVWFAGPHLSLGGQAPLAGPWARALLVTLFVAQYLLHKFWALWRARRTNERVVAELTPASEPEQVGEAAQLRERFAAALEQLRSIRFGARGGHWSALSWSFGRSYVYQLPWYMIIGAPGAGKTTALLNSGLNFPLSATLGRGPIAGVGGTRNCDWWFTDAAVLIDTAGRYTTQDSDSSVDAGAWRAFLKLLREVRPRRPLNGVLIAVSVSDLLGYNASQLAEHALILRRRLDELQVALGVRPPVYVLVTKCDLLPGFVDWFAAADRKERDAVWGVTFDLRAAHAAPAASVFPPAFNDLVNRLADGLLARLDGERDGLRRARIFALPSQVRALGQPLGALLARAFGGTAAASAPMPWIRGVYLTSGTQEGTPIDRILSALGREIGLQQFILPPNHSTGKSFFVSRLLTDVVFAEAGLSGHAPLRQRWQRRALLAGIGVLQVTALGIAAVWLTSYRNSLTEIARLEARVAQVQAALTSLPATVDADPRPLLPVLDALRGLAHDADLGVPRREFIALGSAARLQLRAAAHAAYERLLLGAFQARLAAAVDATLRRGADVNVQYEALKTYAMLTDAAHFDAAGFKVFVLSYWNSVLAPAPSANESVRLTAHLDALIAAGAVGSGLRWDPVLVDAVRSRLQSQSATQRVALRINVLLEQRPFADFPLAALGPAAALFKPPDATSAPLTIPGRYTLEAYRDLVLRETPRIADELAAEAPWVLGAPQDDTAAASDYLSAYRVEYTHAWAKLLNDLQFKPAASNPEALRQIQGLAEPAGALAQLLAAIIRQTPIQLDNASPGPIAVTDPAAVPISELRRLLTPDKVLAASLINSFKELQALRTPAPGASAVESMREERLASLVADARQQPPPVRSMLLALAVIPPGAEARGGSPAAVSRQIAARLSQPCLRLIAGQFPFDRRAPRDAPLRDFAQLFAPGGEFAAVFREQLAGRVDTSGETWVARDPTGPDARDIERFRSAARIRGVFFPADAAHPHLQLTFRPLDLDQRIDRFHLEIDGQNVDYAHGPALPSIVKWPGSEGHARISATPAAGSAMQEYTGPWAVFRLFDHAAIQETDTPGRFVVVFDVDGRHASFQVDSSGGADPFRLRELEHVDCPLKDNGG